MHYALTINGKNHTVDVNEDTPLLWVLRDSVDLKGTKFGCGAGLCGACTVHIDGAPTRACQLAVSDVGSAAITTIEGIGATPAGARLQKAWIDVDVVQCGYCQAGQIMSAAALLTQSKSPSDEEIDAAMDGNICRCGTYARIRQAIKQAAGADFGINSQQRKGA
jgi:isoquinoline 1-oxidoreductase alpha subunit